MPRSFVLMAALPPTVGHTDLIRFAGNLTDDALVIVVTRGNEPYRDERPKALQAHFAHNPAIEIVHLHLDEIEAEGDPYWADMLKTYGFRPGDYLVASESWGEDIAEMLKGEFYPYDIDRELRYTRAAEIREDTATHWSWIVPEFQKLLQRRIVLFGAESIGKSTLTKALREHYTDATSLFEYARPYLEVTPGELDVPKMLGIWRGQKALQRTLEQREQTPRLVFLDTDLYSTLGYWQFWEPETVPEDLAKDAALLKADLYVLLKSNIPFEVDPIRYGGDRREQTDDYWRGVLEANHLPYVEIEANTVTERLAEATAAVDAITPTKIDYERLDR